MGQKKKKEVKEKPLDKMTAKELREVAMEIPEIVGVHSMNKSELISAIKESKGIVDEVKNKSGSVREIKKKIAGVKVLQKKAQEDEDKRMAKIYRRRISRLKKKTRKAA
jgi:MinD-like ATPase involved in chromosome partitioning or flagellar assembly